MCSAQRGNLPTVSLVPKVPGKHSRKLRRLDVPPVDKKRLIISVAPRGFRIGHIPLDAYAVQLVIHMGDLVYDLLP